MKKAFRQYYSITSDEFQIVATHGTVALDSSALLNLFRSSEKTVDELFAVLQAAKSRLWLPYQVGFEYHENLDIVLSDVKTKHRKFSETLDSGLNKLRGAFGDFRHPFVREFVFGAIDSLESQLKDELQKPDWSMKKLEERIAKVRHRIERLFGDSSVGTQLSETAMRELVKDGEKRYKDSVPPGFKDVHKDEGIRKYGDLIIWRELIARAKETAAAVIFVTDDVKEDWWLRVGGETKGALPALRAEMLSEAQQDFYLYTSEQFLKLAAPVFLKRKANAAALEEVERATRAEHLSVVEWASLQKEEEYRRLLDRADNFGSGLTGTFRAGGSLTESPESRARDAALAELYRSGSGFFGGGTIIPNSLGESERLAALNGLRGAYLPSLEAALLQAAAAGLGPEASILGREARDQRVRRAARSESTQQHSSVVSDEEEKPISSSIALEHLPKPQATRDVAKLDARATAGHPIVSGEKKKAASSAFTEENSARK